MGFFGLIPASELAASYNVHTRKLRLYAAGDVQEFTSAIAFHRAPLMGGLEFTLDGWSGPLTDKTIHYTHSQDFDIQLPNPVTPSGTVIIVDANAAKGKAIPIRFLGGIMPSPNETETQALAPETGSDTAVLAAPHHVVFDGLDQPFTIREAAEVPKFGSVQVQFDTEFVTLQTAGIEGSNVVWTFVGKKLGRTQVVVVVAGGVAKYIMSKVHDVLIVPVAKEEEEQGKAEGRGVGS